MNNQQTVVSPDRACYQVRVMNESRCFETNSQNNVLASMGWAENSPVPVGCKGGGCGKCRVKVTSGTYLSKKMSRAHITPRDEEQSIVLACRIFAQSDIHLIPLEA
ncbi:MULTISPECIES: 2Fe-2S iron-sulfur cluster-binding protein [unclassified Oceanobacter]|uniref:2Fe-2S iron-sulfur cluster-binding protein n=1 Tax=unclassified Oceanobacter TaxID=2620260 RepID=UPI0026E3381A|nr:MULTISPECIES: 2Fe-2S iron-sulfur cluster-binding protein [unclassified Oceanobacter]MDO6682440.1 2Fe-2S iron-sulfur cluster-binding protein [Oceanobacter sp. 5_MG-2023]MDP2506386.1 2Fe-2S iron-sulfur cluster-binding protein [Oceanobacter sp. 3_MG-2023]MDP2548807.1 2Fe-2S iron-sulfur cluster-binding protein [Oceanobacter sp. 4_MG-2023]MDP2609232.1 2Fe-2S iron-sulfur cluster-binding protein [Oceanobacter sp. 1_MG-2023]MDP2612476.1 2Fe-2S iron-sulfur cluster-binding protein [Oceanobacter sp. 2